MAETETGGTVFAPAPGWSNLRKFCRALTLGCLIVLLCLAPDLPAQEASGAAPREAVGPEVALPELLTREALRDALARLSDSEVRELVLREFERTIAEDRPEPASGAFVEDIEALGGALRDSWARKAGAVALLPGVPVFFFDRIVGPRSAWIFPVVIGALGLIFLAGYGAERLLRRSIRPLREQVETHGAATASARAGWLLLRLGLDLLGLAVFALVVIALFFLLYGGHEPVRLTAAAALFAVLAVRLVAILARLLLAPHAPNLRLLQLPDRDARRLYRRTCQLGIVGAVLISSIDLLRALGADDALASLLGSVASLLFAAILIGVILHAREAVASLIAGEVGSAQRVRVRGFFANAWHVFAIAYVLVLLLAVEITQALAVENLSLPGIGSLLVVVVVPLLAAGAGHVSDEFWESRARLDAVQVSNYARLSRRCVSIGAIVLALLVLAELWGIGWFDLAADNPLKNFLRTVVEVGLVVLLGYALWVMARTSIDRRLSDRRLSDEGDVPEQHDAGGEGGGGAGASRLRTLLPVLRTFLLATIVVLSTMAVLSSLGVDIGPLLAGAGVVGLAIGFGAQTLVRDVVSGAFFLADDAFRLGEYIDVGEIRGTVEKISIRSLRLRHHRGALHTIPYGEIRHLTNHSRDWVIMKLEFRVPYDTDLKKVKKIFKQIGKELQADPVIGPNLLDPLKSQGVLRMEESAMIIRGKFMAKPGEQFLIRREVYQRVQEAFEANGIQFARPQVSVYVPPGGAAPDSEAVAGAVASATNTGTTTVEQQR